MNENLRLAIQWFPSSPGGVVLLLLLVLGISWWLTGRFFKERDLTTLIFRGLGSLLICFAIGLFNRSLISYLRQGPLAPVIETKEEKEHRLRENLQQWVTPAACDACLKPTAPDPRKLQTMSPAERKEFDASQVTPEILRESAMRGLTWMALEHRQPSPSKRTGFPHSERGTKVLNNLTVSQVQAMFDYIQWVSPRSEPEARPYLADALAYSREAMARPAAPVDEPAGKAAAPLYPRIDASRPTQHGRAFVVRLSPTETRVIEAGSEEEALKKARQP